MSLEEEMKLEIRRLQNEIAAINMQVERINYKVTDILLLRKKKEREIKILKSNIGELRGTERQSTLATIVLAKI